VPITTQFSKQFYDTLGHEIADELVAWFNTVDTTYRSEFRELFELNFSRFNDRLEALRSELEAKLAAAEVRLIRWMFVFWIGSIGTMIALSKF
jgi:hypothetical protein